MPHTSCDCVWFCLGYSIHFHYIIMLATPPSFHPAGAYHDDVMTLDYDTICMSANQNYSVHYNVHSLYGFGETNHTML